MYKCNSNGHAYIVFCGSHFLKEPSVVAQVLYAQLGKKKDQLFLFESFDLSHLSVEHCITSDYYQVIHAARYHTIHIYCLWFKPFSCSSGSCLKNITPCFQMLWFCVKKTASFWTSSTLANCLMQLYVQDVCKAHVKTCHSQNCKTTRSNTH